MTIPCRHAFRTITAVLEQPRKTGQREPDEVVAWLCRTCDYRSQSRSWAAFDAELRVLSSSDDPEPVPAQPRGGTR